MLQNIRKKVDKFMAKKVIVTLNDIECVWEDGDPGPDLELYGDIYVENERMFHKNSTDRIVVNRGDSHYVNVRKEFIVEDNGALRVHGNMHEHDTWPDPDDDFYGSGDHPTQYIRADDISKGTFSFKFIEILEDEGAYMPHREQFTANFKIEVLEDVTSPLVSVSTQPAWQPAWSPSATTRTPNNLDLFVVGNDGRVYTSWWSAGRDWSGINDNWHSCGGFFPPGAPVSAVALTPTKLDLFVVGNDGRVYFSWWWAGSNWSDWHSCGGFFPPGAPVSAVVLTPTKLDLFVVGNDGRVYFSWWSAGSNWSNWHSCGGFFPPGAPVSAVALTPTKLDLFVVGNDGRVYTSWWWAGSNWSDWHSCGGFFPPGAPVSAVARTPISLDLFVVSNDGRVYTSWWSAGWDWSGINDNWKSLGGFFPPGAPVSAVARTPNNLDLFVVGNDGRVYTSSWSEGSNWSNWRSCGGFFPPGAPVSAVARTPNNLDLFVVSNDGRVYTSSWSAGSDWSGINDNWKSLGGFFPVPVG
ncbi:MAG: hypothetical protein ACQEWW_26940 [Bacillota bacterium]